MSLITKEINTNEDNSENENKDVWTREQEYLLAKWADKASCYRWLHDMAEKKFTRLNNFIQIPIIILSTLTGAVSVGTDTIFPASMKNQSGIILGSVSILTGIIGTVGNFLRYAQKMEGHKVAAIQWSKFQRNIAAELAIHPDNRQPAVEFFAICRSELDRMIEQSPTLPLEIIAAFETKFRKVKISKPDVCNILEPVDIFKPHEGSDWVKELTEKRKNTEHKLNTVTATGTNIYTENREDKVNASIKDTANYSSKDEMIITFDNNTPKNTSKNNSPKKSPEINTDEKSIEIPNAKKENTKSEYNVKLHSNILDSIHK